MDENKSKTTPYSLRRQCEITRPIIDNRQEKKPQHIHICITREMCGISVDPLRNFRYVCCFHLSIQSHHLTYNTTPKQTMVEKSFVAGTK